MHREMGHKSLAEVLLPGNLGQNQRLERIEQAVDWVPLGRLVARVYSAREGRPSYPPLLMVKVLLQQQWYNLSDPQMEEALGDRISFRRFVGLGLQDDTPDHSTISRFSHRVGCRSQRATVRGTGPSIGRERDDFKAGDPVGCHGWMPRWWSPRYVVPP